MKQYAYFNELPAKTVFNYNGNLCIKQSTRTAKYTAYDHWFYFGQRDLCIVGTYSRLDSEYFN